MCLQHTQNNPFPASMQADVKGVRAGWRGRTEGPIEGPTSCGAGTIVGVTGWPPRFMGNTPPHAEVNNAAGILSKYVTARA